MKSKSRTTKTIFQVAALSDCSISTVSNVLNNKGRFSEKTQKAVFQAVAKLNYKPDSAGRSLRLKRTETLGLLFYPSCAEIFRNPFYAEVMEGLERTLLKHGYYLLLAGYDQSEPESVAPPFLRQGKVDGVILLGRFPSTLVQRFINFDSPLLLLDSCAEWPVDSLISDGFSAEIDVVSKLYSLGHRRITMVAYDHEDSNIDIRIKGFLTGLKQMNLPHNEDSIIRKYVNNKDIYMDLKSKLLGPTPPTSVVAVNDTLAMDIMSRLSMDGINVPKQVSIVGYDDHATSAHLKPSLSTVMVDKIKLGETGAKMIIDRINSPDSPIVKSILPTKFIVRDSVGAPRNESHAI
jgi:DNA-binding LacI/PurR family transcriptional regulator